MIPSWIIDYLNKQEEEKQKQLEDLRPVLYIEDEPREPPSKEKENESANVIVIQL